MKKLIWLLLVLLILPSLCLLAQEERQFERLMAGEVVELTWDEPITVTLDWETDPFPHSVELIRQFVLERTGDDFEFSRMYGFVLLMRTIGNETILNGQSEFGVAARWMQWDSTTKTLTVQATRFLPVDIRGYELSCGAWLADPAIWGMNNSDEDCLSLEDIKRGEKFLPSDVTYRDDLTVVFLSPEG